VGIDQAGKRAGTEIRKRGLNMSIEVYFLDSGREPQCKADPRYPDGVHLNLAVGAEQKCTRNVPWPAPRCGTYVIECKKCGFKGAIKVGGSPDDPRIVTMPCKIVLAS
jgi:hypothetical protein